MGDSHKVERNDLVLAVHLDLCERRSDPERYQPTALFVVGVELVLPRTKYQVRSEYTDVLVRVRKAHLDPCDLDCGGDRLPAQVDAARNALKDGPEVASCEADVHQLRRKKMSGSSVVQSRLPSRTWERDDKVREAGGD